jgi:hypothetical protein
MKQMMRATVVKVVLFVGLFLLQAAFLAGQVVSNLSRDRVDEPAWHWLCTIQAP